MAILFAESGKSSKDPTLIYVLGSLERLGNKNKSFFILEHEFVGYVQCFGKKGRLTIEHRSYEKDGYKHFTLGKRSENKEIEVVQSTTGDHLMVFSNEVLRLSDAKKVFQEFFTNYSIPSQYFLRNWSSDDSKLFDEHRA
jgi:hypothetical protein